MTSATSIAGKRHVLGAAGFPRRKLRSLLQLFAVVFTVVVVIRTFGTEAINSFDVQSAPSPAPLIHNFELQPAPIHPVIQQKSNDWSFNTAHKVDWHNYAQIAAEAARVGPGEQGKAVEISPNEKNLVDRLYAENGFNAYASDKIALDRSVADIRHSGCRAERYSAELPSVSVVIPYLNEHWSTLLRTVYSVLNRSPPNLLKEIILVDDFSNKEHCKEKLDKYINETAGLRERVQVLHLRERSGLIRARQEGARAATGQVLIFLDSHTEANVNWLPPLLEPIAEDYRTVVCPFIDVLDMDNFEYRAQDEGKRGAFDWELYYKRLDLLPEDLARPTKPFKSPVMAGGLFAISAKFFWELGGYDEGLQIWGGEQYELSFKIWMCGGQMFDAPCSRVGHVYRKFAPFSNGGYGNYLGRNYRRVAEIWMDEYAQYLYMRRPSYKSIDPGDISGQLELRARLKCKSFKWFMENIAFDQPLKYPPIEPTNYAWGYIASAAHPNDVCATASNRQRFSLASCNGDKEQSFTFSWHKDIRPAQNPGLCWDVSQGGNRAPVVPYSCHGQKGNQLWRYDQEKQWILHGGNSRCLTMDVDKKELFVKDCVESDDSQRWVIQNVDSKRMQEWQKDPY